MKIFIIGAGAIGGYVGALLARAGHEVVFGVRPASAMALQTGGLTLVGPRGDFHLDKMQAIASPEEAQGGFDIAISCVKLYDTLSSSRQWAPVLASARAVISLQNGIDGAALIAQGAGLQKVYGGLAYVAAKLEAPGRVRYLSDMSSITFGGAGALNERSLVDLHQQLETGDPQMPLHARLVEDIASAQWQKHAALATNAALTCLVRQPAGIVYTQPELLALAEQSIAEVIATGRAAGAQFPDDHAQKTLAMLKGLPSQMVASMHHDLAAGKPMELEGLIGTVVRHGLQAGVATPFHTFAYACLKPYERGTP
jgi:2-dehydropantoate 2-reductase